MELFDVVITDEMNADLCKPYSQEEISDALFQIGPLKAPGPDGFRHVSFKGIGQFLGKM